jgi:hypothetical protein
VLLSLVPGSGLPIATFSVWPPFLSTETQLNSGERPGIARSGLGYQPFAAAALIVCVCTQARFQHPLARFHWKEQTEALT